jgi:Asp-tRNA(Asn)/Glu-tRNA(Gln) amidotransferase A subunit family amidase
MSRPSSDLSRRELFSALAAAGLTSPVFQRAVAAQAEKAAPIGPDTIKEAEWIAGLKLSEVERKTVANIVNSWQHNFRRLREIKLANDVPMPLAFHPAPWLAPGQREGTVALTGRTAPARPTADDQLALLPLTDLAGLVRTRKVSSVELTKLYLKRLKEYDPVLQCVVTLTEKTALAQAEQADKEIAAGKYRGPLHGIPWGAKDLIAYPGYPTTWGAEPYKDQKLDTKATVAKRLDEAGSVLVAKLSLGELAWGDEWFGNRKTKSPWNPKAGSSGSSAGPACATAAGLVGFSLGSETLGSIVSPGRVCGNSSLRPTFGRVSRAGCMALAWSMDKVGPICRSVEDCALVFGAIHGRDGLDATAVDRPFCWPSKTDLKTLRVGHLKGTPEKDLKVLSELGVRLMPITLPSKYPTNELTVILDAEAAAVFDELGRSGMAKGPKRWQPTFQGGQFISASDYLRANRIRALLMKEMEDLMSTVDLYVGGPDLVLTNLTGHPQLILPTGFRKRGDTEQPTTMVLTGRLFGESQLLAVGHAYQQATGHHRKHPDMNRLKQGGRSRSSG